MRLLMAAMAFCIATPSIAEDPNFALFGIAEKHDFAVRLLPEHENYTFGYNDSKNQDLILATNSASIVGLGVRIGDYKFMYGEPSGLESREGVSTSNGRTFQGHLFRGSHYLFIQHSSLSGFYQLIPEEYYPDGSRMFPKREDLKIVSQQFRYSYNFEPENYSLRAKHLQIEVDSEKDGAAFFVDFRMTKDKFSGNGTSIVPSSLQSELSPDDELLGYELLQLSPFAGLGYMMRERAIYATLDLQLGCNYQSIEIYELGESRSSTDVSLAYSVESSAGLVLANAYLSALLHLESYQIMLRERYLEQTRSYLRIELGTRF